MTMDDSDKDVPTVNVMDGLPEEPPERLSEASTVRRQSVNSDASSQSPSGTQGNVRKKTRSSVKKKSGIFVDKDAIKDRIRAQAMVHEYDVSDFYSEYGLFPFLATHSYFENLTLVVITINALWISIDADLNTADTVLDALPVFQIVEHAFCFYFSLEWFVRFKSFKRKLNGLKDAWFVFDSALVLMMVFETWVMNLGILLSGSAGNGALANSELLRMARLLRLSRMLRMARLFRAMPELLILIKAMVSSLRSCFFVFVLLSVVIYVFSIAMKQLAAGTVVGSTKFLSVPQSMHTLWIDGTLMDNTGDLVAELAEESFACVVTFYIFLLLSALTIMNMLIGVLCEVVSAVAAAEKETLMVNFVKSKLLDCVTAGNLDEDGSGTISKAELSKLLEFPVACKALAEVGVDVYMLVDNIDYLFAMDEHEDLEEPEEKVLGFDDFMNLMLELRGSNAATVKDCMELQKCVKRSAARMLVEIRSCIGEIQTFRRANSMPLGSLMKHQLSDPRGNTFVSQIPATGHPGFDDIKKLMSEFVMPEIREYCSTVQQDIRIELQRLSTLLPEFSGAPTGRGTNAVAEVSRKDWSSSIPTCSISASGDRRMRVDSRAEFTHGNSSETLGNITSAVSELAAQSPSGLGSDGNAVAPEAASIDVAKCRFARRFV